MRSLSSSHCSAESTLLQVSAIAEKLTLSFYGKNLISYTIHAWLASLPHSLAYQATCVLCTIVLAECFNCSSLHIRPTSCNVFLHISSSQKPAALVRFILPLLCFLLTNFIFSFFGLMFDPPTGHLSHCPLLPWADLPWQVFPLC